MDNIGICCIVLHGHLCAWSIDTYLLPIFRQFISGVATVGECWNPMFSSSQLATLSNSSNPLVLSQSQFVTVRSRSRSRARLVYPQAARVLVGRKRVLVWLAPVGQNSAQPSVRR